jgi:exopolysaccharide biosynthesis polyprenyl glycosylphosphotransferase
MNKKQQLIKYLTADYVAALFSWLAFFFFRQMKVMLNPEASALLDSSLPVNLYWGLLLVPVFWLFVHYLSGYYQQTLRKSRLSEFFTTLYSSIAGTLILFFIIVMDDMQSIPAVNYKYFYQAFVALFIIQFGSTYLLRFIITQRTTVLVHNRKLAVNTLIIGTGKNAQTVARQLETMRWSLGNKIVGFVAPRRDGAWLLSEAEVRHVSTSASGSPLEGELEGALEDIVQRQNIQEVIFCPEEEDNDLLFNILGRLNRLDVDVKYLPNIDKLVTGKWHLNTIYGIPLVSISNDPMSDWQKAVKRTMDILFSLTSLALLSPFFALLAFLIKQDSKGSVFYQQERIGKHGKPFYIHKFRTMKTDAESDGVPRLSSSKDERVTQLGRLLRKYRIDELPQFWNVLKGDMSMVGPRPERQYFIDRIVETAPYYYLVQRVKPGITSWGMVKYGYADTVKKMIDRLEYDIIYVENTSLMIDLKILIYTIKTIVTGKGI